MRECEPLRYFLQISRECVAGCRFCSSLGCRNSVERDLTGLHRAIRRAKAGGYGSILFAPSLLNSPLYDDALAACRSEGFPAAIILDWTVFQSLEKPLRSRLAASGLGLDLIFDGTEPLDAAASAALRAIESEFPELDLTICPRGEADLENLIHALQACAPEMLKRLHFHFTPFTQSNAASIPVQGVYRRLSRLQRRFPELLLRPQRGREVWDPRISPDLCLEPDVKPLFRNVLAESIPAISVVIPTYNSRSTVGNVLRHLFRQGLARRDFEVIVVDDGSTDGTTEEIRALVAGEGRDTQLTYLYFPRARARKMGDGNYRAGIARNLGAKSARGRILSFLDADILVPSNFLADLLRRHESHDVIQCVRLHIKNRVATPLIRHDEIDPARDTYVLEKNYWGPFFGCADWNAIPCFWKYTCTYGLSLPADTFRKIGRFGKTFVHYGFEDTDFGYRLARAGYRFHLSPMITYHLPPPNERSEYSHSTSRRNLLLSKTAKTFYLNHLDPAIYEHFGSFMLGDPALFEVRLRLRKWMSHARD